MINDYLCNHPESEFFEILRDGLPSFVKIPIQNIMYFYLSGKQLYVRTLNDEFILTERVFSSIVDKYMSKGFYESFRNYLVNVGKIVEVCDNYAILCNDEKVPVSKRARKGLIRAVSDYILLEEAY